MENASDEENSVNEFFFSALDDEAWLQTLITNPDNRDKETVTARLQDVESDNVVVFMSSNDLTPFALTVLRRYPDETIWQEVAEHPNTAASVLETLASDENYEVRLAVTENDNTHDSTIFRLMADEDESVNDAARKAFNTEKYSPPFNTFPTTFGDEKRFPNKYVIHHGILVETDGSQLKTGDGSFYLAHSTSDNLKVMTVSITSSETGEPVEWTIENDSRVNVKVNVNYADLDDADDD